MKVVETRPGKTYAVECVGEVTVTNTRTGAVVATGDGSGQVYFVAADLQYTFSDATAIVTELFKLAPRLRLTLLQGVAGGWLPEGFTELEYLVSSGTQNIVLDTPNLYSSLEKWNVQADIQFLTTSATRLGFKSHQGLSWGATDGVIAFSTINSGISALERNTVLWTTQNVPQPSMATPAYLVQTLQVRGQQFSTNGIGQATTPPAWKFGLFRNTYFTNSDTKPVKVWGYTCWCDSVSYDLIPVLNENGEPGMWDKVSKLFFGNAGDGTFGYRIKRTGEIVSPMSLRDPYYVAPSGVYARVNGENALDIVADTEEPPGEGWEWFANTAEANEHFGIVPQEEELLTE